MLNYQWGITKSVKYTLLVLPGVDKKGYATSICCASDMMSVARVAPTRYFAALFF